MNECRPDFPAHRRHRIANGEVALARASVLLRQLGCEAIVMGADPPKNRVLGDFDWSQEPYSVQRRARIPVHHLVVDGGTAKRR